MSTRLNVRIASRRTIFAVAVSALPLFALPMANAQAQALSYAPASTTTWSNDDINRPDIKAVEDDAVVMPERLKRTTVNFPTREAAGTIVIDTGNTALYYVLGGGKAIRYGVGVGREGFTWSGVQAVTRKTEWPDWHPPQEMIARQPYLPRFMAGGPGNPLGARAMYLGSSVYRIHGTNDPTTIGKFVSSGCIRLTNEDVTDLFNRVNVGTKVIVLAKSAPLKFEAAAEAPRSVTSASLRELRAGAMSSLY